MRRRNFLRYAAMLPAAASHPYAVTATSRARSVNPEEIPSQVESIIPKLLKSTGVPGLSAAVIQDGKVSWAKGFGVRDVLSGQPVNNDTIFECASVSKTVFAYAVMKLCEKGTLALDTPLVNYASITWVGNDPRASKITPRHILSHTSGLPNWRSKEEPLKLYFDPGTAFRYSGEGYNYLQTVISHLKGTIDTTRCGNFEEDFRLCASDIGQYLAVNVLIPLQMRSSSYLWSADLARNMAIAHSVENKHIDKPHQSEVDLARYAAAGGLLTTATDLSKFVINLFDPKEVHPFFLTRSSLTEMLRPQIKLPADQHIDGATSWGLGWGVQERPGGNVIVHSGGQSGFKSIMMASANRRTGFVLLSNSDSGGRVLYDEELGKALDRLFVG